MGGGGLHYPLQTCLLACNEVMNKDVTNSIEMYNGWIILSLVCTLFDLIGMLSAYYKKYISHAHVAVCAVMCNFC